MEQNNIRYTETQPFRLTLYFTAILCALYITGNAIDGGYAYVFGELRFYLVLLIFISPAVFWGTMTIQITDEDIVIRFGLLPFRKRIIPLADISEVAQTDIRWMKDFKFIGVTYGRDTGDIGYFVSYGSGIRMALGDFSVFIGSRRANECSKALKTALRDVRSGMARD